MAEINMIPLIDVMLVLLVIFIITAPLLTHAVKIDLPRAASAVNVPKPENVHLSIDAAGTVYWNGEPVARPAWRARMADAARGAENTGGQPELHIRADGELAYRFIAQVMSDAAAAGLTHIGFVTDPRDAPCSPLCPNHPQARFHHPPASQSEAPASHTFPTQSREGATGVSTEKNSSHAWTHAP
jgi:biopolymer transport protein ExbD